MEVKEPSATYRLGALRETEVGPVPADWNIVRLGEITDPDRPISYGIVQTGPRVLNGVPCLRVVDIQDGKVQLDDLITTSTEISNSYRRTKLREGDLVVPLRGKVGECAQVPASLVDANLTRGVAIVALLPQFSAGFCRQFFSSTRSRARLYGAMNGSALQEVPIATLRTFKIAVPPTSEEQRAITQALSDADTLIDSLQHLLTKKLQIKEGAMQELLTGKRRLPGFSGEWMMSPLGDLAKIKTGSMNNQDKVADGAFPFFVRSQTVEQIDTFTHDCEAILIPGEGGIGSIFHYVNGRFALHQRVYGITEFSVDLLGRFLFFYVRVFFAAHAMQNSVKATVDSLRRPTFLDFEVRVPPTMDEQAAIVKVLSDLEDEADAIDSRLTKARALKQAMAQALLTGKIRLI